MRRCANLHLSVLFPNLLLQIEQLGAESRGMIPSVSLHQALHQVFNRRELFFVIVCSSFPKITKVSAKKNISVLKSYANILPSLVRLCVITGRRLATRPASYVFVNAVRSFREFSRAVVNANFRFFRNLCDVD